MLSLIEVKCPHCGARGQLMLPPLGSLIVGPCPECEELVAVFCGCILPLDKEVMLEAPVHEKHEHLMMVLASFMEERVSRLLKETPHEEASVTGVSPEEGYHEVGHDMPELPAQSASETISRNERDDFVKVDLNLIDNHDYFKSVFG